MNIVEEHWEQILNKMKLEYCSSNTAYKTWIAPLTVYEVADNTVYILVQLKASLEHIEEKYLLPFKVCIAEVTGEEYEVSFVTEDQRVVEQKKAITIQNQKSNLIFEQANLNLKYTFDTFVVGNNNRFAHAASVAVSESPGTVYNPLFIYGGAGLGKTHLMHSIAHFILENDPTKKVLYVTSETFTNELIDALKVGRTGNDLSMNTFRDKYRNIDVLLIDDIQFIIGKESTQEEFFHTFNHLHGAGKQIIISSDKPPKDIETLEDRLRTRFEWGLLADIQPPDLETRLAIINAKAMKLGFELPRDIMYQIAENLQSNVRQLEGTVKKIKAKHELNGEPISAEMVATVIEEVKSINPGLNPTPDMILQTVSNFYSMPVDQILANKRSKDTVRPRQMAMYLVRKLTSYSLPEIGKVFGRDHTTVMHACNKIEDERKKSAETDDIIRTLIENIQNI